MGKFKYFFWRVDNWKVQVRCAAGCVFLHSNVTASESELYCSCIPDYLVYYFSGSLSYLTAVAGGSSVGASPYAVGQREPVDRPLNRHICIVNVSSCFLINHRGERESDITILFTKRLSIIVP